MCPTLPLLALSTVLGTRGRFVWCTETSNYSRRQWLRIPLQSAGRCLPTVVFYPEGALRWCMGSKLSCLLVDGSGACVCPDDISGNQTQFGMLRF